MAELQDVNSEFRVYILQFWIFISEFCLYLENSDFFLRIVRKTSEDANLWSPNNMQN